MKRQPPISRYLFHAAEVLIATAIASPSNAAGRMGGRTLVQTPLGNIHGVTSHNRSYRVPCQLIAPTNFNGGRRLLLSNWPLKSTFVTAVSQGQADARYVMTDELLSGQQVISSVGDE